MAKLGRINYRNTGDAEKDFLNYRIELERKLNYLFDNISPINKTPSSATDTGTTGTICWDSSYIYVCISTNTWVRSSLATW